MNPNDIKRIREHTPGSVGVIHFNNAGAALQPAPVFQAVTDHLNLEYQIGGYEAAAKALPKTEAFYQSFATLLNCQPNEIAYIENATRAWDMLFYSIPFKKGDRILTARSEYISNYLAYLQVAQRHGVIVEAVPDDESGQLDLAALDAMIDENVKLIAITHIPTHGGLVNPAIGVGKIARKHNVLYLLDACQSVGQIPLDVQEIGCDMLTGTGRKFLRGPRGTGFLYVRHALIESLEPPFIDLHAADWVDQNTYKIRPDARRFENWESHIAGRVGLAAAVDYALDIGLENIKQRVYTLAQIFRTKLADIPGVEIRDRGTEQCGIVTFTKAGETGLQISKRLREKHINTSVAVVEHARIDMTTRGLKDMVRASVHYYNTEVEIERFCEVLAEGCQ